MNKNQDGFLIGALLLHSADALQRRVHQGYQAAGFTDIRPAHEPVFGLLSPDGERIIDLAKKARTTKQAMGYLVDYLEEHGYLERIPDPHDGRSQIVRRTEKGWQVNRLAKQLVQEIQNEWADQLGHERMEQLLVLLRDLVKIIGVDYEGSASQHSTRHD
jgi:DNA-binding MarR family transcriptional regulator